MQAARAHDARIRWSISGIAALVVHGVVVLVMPDAPSQEHVSSADVMWLSALADAPADRLANDPGASGDARPASAHAVNAGAESARASVAARRAARARDLPRGQRARAPLSSEPSAAAPMPSTVAPSRAMADASMQPTAGAALEVAGAGLIVGGAAGESALGLAAAAALGGVGSLSGQAALGNARKPGLLATRNPCSGFFPAAARADHGAVQLSVEVDATGHTRAARVLAETPVGQQFGRAARACAAALRFVPAADGMGVPVAGAARLELRFSRSS